MSWCDAKNPEHECTLQTSHIEKGKPHRCCCKTEWDDEETSKYMYLD